MKLLHSHYKEEADEFSILYRQHAPALLTHLQINAASREDAEDLLIDVFVAALEYATFETLTLSEQRAWLWRVARNKLIDSYRRASHREKIRLDEIVETLPANAMDGPEQAAVQQEEALQLQQTLKQLPKLQQQIIDLRFVNGLRCGEIAELLGKRDGSVRTLLSRTLNMLRHSYEK